ncbi:cysteine--tRNA ligase, partial [bacterium]|nr:cysteine--tRNA ligase [bacterium]
SVYFDISRFKDYGKLSRIDLEKIRLGKTVDLDQYEKENPRDFTLLKRATLDELKRGIFYQTQWGNIRPGWHIECAAMAMKYLGPTYDIHTSGANLIFPHHENSIAISQAVTDKPLANYWIHNELVMINGKKSSFVSEEETMTLRGLLDQGYTGREVRYWLLSRHYRKPVFFSQSKLDSVKNTISHLDKFVHKLYFLKLASEDSDIDQVVYDLRRKFVESMDDDLNIAAALAGLFQFTHHVNRIMDRNGLSIGDRDKVLKALERINSVLDVMDLKPTKVDQDVVALIDKREQARRNKEWDTADHLRQELTARGIEVIDTKDGPVWRKAKKVD